MAAVMLDDEGPDEKTGSYGNESDDDPIGNIRGRVHGRAYGEITPN